MENPKKKKNPSQKGYPTVRKPTGQGKILDHHRKVFAYYREQGFRRLPEAMRKSGAYSPGTLKTPATVRNSQSWKSLCALYMPDERLLMRHNELLDKRDIYIKKEVDPLTGEVREIEIDRGPETAAVSKGLELAYKTRGKFGKDASDDKPAAIMYNLFYKPEVREKVRAFEETIKQTYIDDLAKRYRHNQENGIEEDAGSVESAHFTDTQSVGDEGGVPPGHDGDGDEGVPEGK
jgi:hypothetical protein